MPFMFKLVSCSGACVLQFLGDGDGCRSSSNARSRVLQRHRRACAFYLPTFHFSVLFPFEVLSRSSLR